MANIFLRPTAQFKPFSYQEMLAPIKSYTDAYNNLNDELGNLDIMAGDVASKLTNPLDGGLRQQYKSFQDELNSTMNSLYTEGLTSDNKRKLTELKVKYTRDLNPINEAYKAYQTDQQYINKLAIEHPEIIIENAGKSVSDYIGGKSPQMRSINLDAISKDVAQVSETAASRTYKDLGWVPEAGGKILSNVTKSGLTEEEFSKAIEDYISGTSNPNSELVGRIYENAISQYSNFKSPENQKKIQSSILEGMKKGFAYKEDKKTIQNPGYVRPEPKSKDTTPSSTLGSSYYMTSKERVGELKNTFLNRKGELKKDFDIYFGLGDNSILRDELDIQSNYPVADWSIRGGHPRNPIPVDVIAKSKTMTSPSTYQDILNSMLDLGLDPTTTTKEQFIAALQSEADIQGRERGRMIVDNSTKDIWNDYIDSGLVGGATLKEVKGISNTPISQSNPNKAYRTKSLTSEEVAELRNDDGKFDILNMNIDYATGEKTFTIKQVDKKGKVTYREFLLPEQSNYDVRTQANIDNSIQYYIDAVRTAELYGLDINDPTTTYTHLLSPSGKELSYPQYLSLLKDNIGSNFETYLNYQTKRK